LKRRFYCFRLFAVGVEDVPAKLALEGTGGIFDGEHGFQPLKVPPAVTDATE